MVRLPVRAPGAEGVNVTVSVQLAPDDNLVKVHGDVTEKSAAFVPLMVPSIPVNVADPTFVSVSVMFPEEPTARLP